MYKDSRSRTVNMTNETVLRAMFAQQRAQLLFMKSMDPEFISDAYAYAWASGVYPICEDGDYSVPELPHEVYKDLFIIGPNLVNEVLKFLDGLWVEGKFLTFYQLEDQFGGKDNRCELISICRYAYLSRMFDDKLWDSLLTAMKHPAEAKGITNKFKDYDIALR